MGRDRYQKGWVEETGKRVKKWKGHYHVYVIQLDGTEKRVHKALIIGPKSEMRKWEAEQKLATHIESATAQATQAPNKRSAATMTLRWFWEERYRPMKEPTWKESSRKETVGNIRRYVIDRIGDNPLSKLDKYSLQIVANQLAAQFSKSVVEKYIVWTRAILEEAVEQELLPKNPARKLTMPEVRKVGKRVATPDEIAIIFCCIDQCERIMLCLTLVLGLRPGELFALRWDDVGSDSLRVDEATRYGKIYDPKTDASAASVWLPPEIKAELDGWRLICPNPSPAGLIFQSPKGKVVRLDNFRKRVLKPALDNAVQRAAELGLISTTKHSTLPSLTFQICRRSCGTYMQKHGGVKDIQAHLRHAQASTTMNVYVQQIPQSVRDAVNSLYRALFGSLIRAQNDEQLAPDIENKRHPLRAN